MKKEARGKRGRKLREKECPAATFAKCGVEKMNTHGQQKETMSSASFDNL